MTMFKSAIAASVISLPLVGFVQASNVTPGVIFGSGNANGSFTIDQDNGVELGLRAKLRHNAVGSPENTFNYNGTDTYTFKAGVAPTLAIPTAVWSFEWSINTNYLGTSGGFNLDDLTYSLSMNSPTGASITAFDPIHDNNPALGINLWDHSIGNNLTTYSNDNIANTNISKPPLTDVTVYQGWLSTNNVAQNSWKPSWFAVNFNPNAVGEYYFTLSAFNDSGKVASTSMTVNVVPVPAAAWAGMSTLAGMGGLAFLRRRKAQQAV